MQQPVYYVYDRSRLKNRRTKKRYIPIFILLIATFAILFITKDKYLPHQIDIDHQANQNVLEASTSSVEITPIPITPSEKIPTHVSDDLGNAVQNALIGTYGNYGIVVKNLKTGETYFMNEHRKFQSGSLYKLWVMATAFNLIQNNKLKETDIVSQNVLSLYRSFNIDIDPTKTPDETLRLTVGEALYQMITISDNNAALLLTQKVKISNISSFLENNNFAESTLSKNDNTPTTTAYDIGLFFEKLYRGELGNSENTARMTSLLKEQKLNDKIPTYLPDDIVIAHKTGELNEFTHDAGIVYAPKGEYIIVILSESDSPQLAKKRISDVSEAVYSYFLNQ